MDKNIDKLYCLAPTSYIQMMGYVYRLNDKLIVIDGGTKEDYFSLLDIVKNNGSVIDLLIVTHCHQDHIGALVPLIRNKEITIKEIIYDFPPLESIKQILATSWEYEIVLDFIQAVKERKIKTSIPELNKIYQLGDFQYVFLKLGNLQNNDINDSSMIFKLISPSKSIMFLGDISPTYSEYFASKYEGSNGLKADYVQLAHHGQAGGSYKLYSLIKPKYAFWNAPRWLYENDAGNGKGTGPYKSNITKKWLEDLNIKSLFAFDKTLII